MTRHVLSIGWKTEFDEGFKNRCPANSTCHTFREEYGDGRGLCNQIWGNSIFYSTNKDNCTVMAFNSSMPNPNYKLTFPHSGQHVNRENGLNYDLWVSTTDVPASCSCHLLKIYSDLS